LVHSSSQNTVKEERQPLVLLFDCAPELKLTYYLYLQLAAVFDADHSKALATAATKGWVKCVSTSQLGCFDGFLGDVGELDE
jgi:Transposase